MVHLTHVCKYILRNACVRALANATYGYVCDSKDEHPEPRRVAYRCRIGHFTDRVVIITPIPRGSSPRTARTEHRTIGFGCAGGADIGRGGTEPVGRCSSDRRSGSGRSGLIYRLIPPILRLRRLVVSVRESGCVTQATQEYRDQPFAYIFIYIFSHFPIYSFPHYRIF